MYGPLAQLVEQQTLNLWGEGSIPSWLNFFPVYGENRSAFIFCESGEMADTLDLGSSAYGVGVQVPPLVFILFCREDVFFILDIRQQSNPLKC